MNAPSTTPDSLPQRAGSLRELLVIAVPLIISYGSMALMYAIDRMYLSWYSVEAMAAALPAGVLHYNLAALGIGTVAYCNAFVGQYEGARQHARVGPVLWQGVYVAAIMSVLLALTVPLAPAVFRWFGHGEVVQPLEIDYYRVMALGSAPLLLEATLACFFSGRGKTTVVMLANITGCSTNIVLDYALIFGKFGFPALGIKGAALATVISFGVIAAFYIVVIAWTERESIHGFWTGWRFDPALFGRLLKFGLPSGCQQFLDIACFTAFIQLVGRLGTEQLSATSLVFNLNSLVFIPMLGMGTAVTVIVGHRIGEGRPRLAVRTVWMAAGVGMIYTAAFCLVYLFAPDAIIRPYGLGNSETLRDLVVFLLRFVAVYSFFDALAVIFSSAVRGAGDTRFALLFSFSLGVILMVIPTFIASGYGEAGFQYAWYSVTVFIVTLGLGFVARFQQGRWQHMKVIEHTLAEGDEEDPTRDVELEGAAT